MKHILSSTQFNKEQLHYLFNVAHEMRMAVKRSGGSDLLKARREGGSEGGTKGSQ